VAYPLRFCFLQRVGHSSADGTDDDVETILDAAYAGFACPRLAGVRGFRVNFIANLGPGDRRGVFWYLPERAAHLGSPHLRSCIPVVPTGTTDPTILRVACGRRLPPCRRDFPSSVPQPTTKNRQLTTDHPKRMVIILSAASRRIDLTCAHSPAVRSRHAFRVSNLALQPFNLRLSTSEYYCNPFESSTTQ